MFNTLAALVLAFTGLFAGAPVSETVQATPAPHCATMGENFQCDEERAMEAMEPYADIWEDFNVTYLTTRLDGVEPVDGPHMTHVQDSEFPNMYHVYTLTYAPIIHNV